MENPIKQTINNNEICADRPESFLRIQRRDEYAKFCDLPKYLASGQIEVRIFSIYGKNLLKKIGGETKQLIAGHLECINKGYPRGFKDYLTYDERRELNYQKRLLRKVGMY